MKKINICFISLLILLLISSCKKITNDKINIVCSSYSIYDWTYNIVKDNDNINLILLNDNGIDVHNYNPSVNDIINITNCDLLIYNGGESDYWIDNALKNIKNDKMIILNLINILGDKIILEEDEEEIDEHIHLSVDNVIYLLPYILDSIIKIDNENIVLYQHNYSSYYEKIEELKIYENNLLNIDDKQILVIGDRFPFRYLLNEYNIKYYAAFSGCSTEAEASINVIFDLAKIIDDNNIKYVIKLVGTKNEIANKIIMVTNDKNQKIIYLDPIENKTKDDLNKITYLDIMKNNIDNIYIVIKGE